MTCSSQSTTPTHPGCRCIGDDHHTGRHWCLLGHSWPADESEEEA